MPRSFLAVLFFFISIAFNSQSFAASYAIMPFNVNGDDGFEYLEKAIPPMFNSRLFLAGVNEPSTGQDKILNLRPTTDPQAAEKIRKQYDVDQLVFGSITIIGDNASLDVSVVGKDNTWQKAVQTNINSLFNAVQTVSDSINREIFGRTITNTSGRTTNRAPLNSSIIANESSPEVTSSYLNPEFRYQGTETERTRTRPVPYESYGFEIADFTGDGKEDIAILSEDHINIYRYEDNNLNPILSHRLPVSYTPLRIRSLEYKGNMYLVLAASENSNGNARSLIYKVAGNKLDEVADSNYYLTVAPISALGADTLIGQRPDNTRFVRGAVYQMNFDGSTVSRGRAINLPKGANLFNFTWLPGAIDAGGDHLLVIDDEDKLLTFNAQGKRIAKSEDLFASSGVRIRTTRDISGFKSQDGQLIDSYYYVPMRIVTADLDKNGQYEAITSKPISTAMIFLNNYRTYSQGEVHSQIWDGLGMSLLWKTRRIKGTIIDLDIADPDNDGVTDLVVNVNTYPGTSGVGKIRTLVVLYPLDTSSIDTSAINYSE